ncbi:MAG: MtrB/PioB family decaheme-associated outer membrane protein, partial [Gammaproteobacteria bacterium]
PVDYTTDDLELSAEYRGDSWQASVRFLGAFFDNGDSVLAWENPYSGPTGVLGGARALAPGNESHQLALSGAWRFPGRTVLNGQLSFASLSQDEELLPYTIDPAISAAPLPTVSANAKADVVNFNLRAMSSPWRRTTLEAEVRLNDFDNKTPVNLYEYVVTDTVTGPGPVANRAYDYERTELKLRGEYRASTRARFSLGFDTKRFQRNFQDRSRTRTNRVWFRVRSRFGDGGDVDLEAFVEDRTGSSFDVLDASAVLENPLMRKYNLSDRERFGLRLTGSLYPASRWDVGWEVEYGRDDYTESRIGLTKTSYARAGLDASWLVVEQGSLYASLFTERVDVAQAGSQTGSLPDWSATTEDDFDTATVGYHHPGLLGPIGVRLDYTWSRGTGETGNNTSGRLSRFPDLKSVRQTVGVGLDYALSDAWRLGFDYYHEKLNSHDWALDGLEPATVPNLLALGADPFNYDVNVVYFSVRYIARGQGL